jgi:hypothetical protein
MALDLKIHIETIGNVFSRRNVSAPGHATMPEFLGDIEEGHSDGSENQL